MTVYMKNFIFASLFYLGLATIFGILNGTSDIGYIGTFAHTHFNLLGFMCMIVFGIGYFIIPRFNGVDLRFDSWVGPHFWIANISLIGMVFFRWLEFEQGETIYSVLFISMATLQAISIFMFILNVWLTLTPKKKETAKPNKTETKKISPSTSKFSIEDDGGITFEVKPSSRVSDLVDYCPTLQDVLIENGLIALQMPGHIEKVKKMGITLEMAANNHSLNLNRMIENIEKYLSDPNNIKAAAKVQKPDPDELTLNTLIGDVIATHPKAKEIFRNYFGDGCFDCPGQSYESIDMACRMHNVDPDKFFVELKDKIG